MEKNCASRWSLTKNHYVMHGQQNIKNAVSSVHFGSKTFRPAVKPASVSEF
jgi:hypothetical protein